VGVTKLILVHFEFLSLLPYQENFGGLNLLQLLKDQISLSQNAQPYQIERQSRHMEPLRVTCQSGMWANQRLLSV